MKASEKIEALLSYERDFDKPQQKTNGYLCEGGSQCPHGADSTHWVDFCSCCGKEDTPLKDGLCLFCETGKVEGEE
jgi:hypothetical protein